MFQNIPTIHFTQLPYTQTTNSCTRPMVPTNLWKRIPIHILTVCITTTIYQKSKYIQQIIGSLLYYTRSVNPKILYTINVISYQQSNRTEYTYKLITHLLNYMHTYPVATIRYHQSNMVLNFHSDAS